MNPEWDGVSGDGGDDLTFDIDRRSLSERRSNNTSHISKGEERSIVFMWLRELSYRACFLGLESIVKFGGGDESRTQVTSSALIRRNRSSFPHLLNRHF